MDQVEPGGYGQHVPGPTSIASLSSPSSAPTRSSAAMAVSDDCTTFQGYLSTTEDALLLIEGSYLGLCRRIRRRLHNREHGLVRSGAVFVFNEAEANMKRWTDKLVWSPSRQIGAFFVYRQMTTKVPRGTSMKQIEALSLAALGGRAPLIDPNVAAAEKPYVASLITSPQYAREGLVKKTLCVGQYHVISYFSLDDVQSGRLRTPSQTPDFANVQVSARLQAMASAAVAGGGQASQDGSDGGNESLMSTSAPQSATWPSSPPLVASGMGMAAPDYTNQPDSRPASASAVSDIYDRRESWSEWSPPRPLTSGPSSLPAASSSAYAYGYAGYPRSSNPQSHPQYPHPYARYGTSSHYMPSAIEMHHHAGAQAQPAYARHYHQLRIQPIPGSLPASQAASPYPMQSPATPTSASSLRSFEQRAEYARRASAAESMHSMSAPGARCVSGSGSIVKVESPVLSNISGAPSHSTDGQGVVLGYPSQSQPPADVGSPGSYYTMPSPAMPTTAYGQQYYPYEQQTTVPQHAAYPTLPVNPAHPDAYSTHGNAQGTRFVPPVLSDLLPQPATGYQHTPQ